jgi:hypothetical protein
MMMLTDACRCLLYSSVAANCPRLAHAIAHASSDWLASCLQATAASACRYLSRLVSLLITTALPVMMMMMMDDASEYAL